MTLITFDFKKIFYSSPIPSCVIQDNHFSLINRKLAEAIGYTEQELLKIPFAELIYPDDRSWVLENALNRLAGKTVPDSYEFRVLTRRGEIAHVAGFFTFIEYNNHPAIFAQYINLNKKQTTENELMESEKRRLIEEELRQSEEKHRTLFETMTQGVVYQNAVGEITSVNPAAEKILGSPLNVIIGRTSLDLHLKAIHEDGSDFPGKEHPLMVALKTGKQVRNVVMGVYNPLDGEHRWIKINAIPQFRAGEDKPYQVFTTFDDITELKIKEEELRAAHQQLLDIIESLPDATFVVDKDKKVIAWNQCMEELTGVGKEDIIGKGDYAYAVPFYGEARPILIDMIIPGDSESELRYEYIERKENTIYGEAFTPSLFGDKGAYLWGKASPLFDSEGNLIGAIESIRDITERKRTEEQLKYLSLHDPLTGLYNRTFFEEEMRRTGDGRYDPVGIIVFDLDGLKLVNDTLGHDTGDSLLVAAAGIISSSFRKSDIVARIGGDEFAILLNQSDEKVVEEACARIRDAIDRYNATGPEIPLNISMGFAVGSKETASVNDLFKEADNNMYREKLHHGQSARSAIVQTLMKALKARDFITEGHAVRLQDHVMVLAGAIGMPARNISELCLLAKFHDIGKVGVPDRILFKPGPLSFEEVAEMRRHCEIGLRIAQSAPDLVPIADWILKHHEWWNGKGYPLGLKGEEIPLECRILAIADAYDAMTSDRPYRKALTHEKAVEELKNNAGVQFDPNLVFHFLELLENNQSL